MMNLAETHTKSMQESSLLYKEFKMVSLSLSHTHILTALSLSVIHTHNALSLYLHTHNAISLGHTHCALSLSLIHTHNGLSLCYTHIWSLSHTHIPIAIL